MRLIFALILCLAWSISFAAESPVIKQLKSLVDQQNYAAAFELASQHAFDLEGDDEFDFLYGLSALQTGKFEPALFSFERLASGHPQVLRYRLELARSYFYLGNLEQAEKEFDRVLATNPPEGVQHNIQKFKDSINAQRKAVQSQWHASVTAALGYDDNYNSATSAENLEIDLGGLRLTSQLTQEQRHQESPFAQVRAISTYTSPINRHTSWDITAFASHRLITDDNDYSLSVLGTQAGLRRIFGKLQLRPSVGLSQYWLGGESFQQDAYLAGEAYYRLSPNIQPFARLTVTASNNKVNDDTDRIRPNFETGLGLVRGALSGQVSINYATDIEQHSSKIYMRDTLGVSLFGQYKIGKGDIYANALWQSNDYHEEMLIFNKKRDETFTQFLIGYRHSLSRGFSVYGQASHINNSSNLNIYQYRRTVAETGISLAF